MSSPWRILLAEDDRFLRRACETALSRRGYTVTVAEDGEQALAMARAEHPDLLLLDDRGGTAARRHVTGVRSSSADVPALRMGRHQ
jgi:DNA-binding response OmpR family regulator